MITPEQRQAFAEWNAANTDRDWADSALCSQTDPEAFFPSQKGEDRPQRNSVLEAKATCRSCDVSTECLTYALDNGEEYGIWGGTLPGERRGMAKRRRGAA